MSQALLDLLEEKSLVLGKSNHIRQRVTADQERDGIVTTRGIAKPYRITGEQVLSAANVEGQVKQVLDTSRNEMIHEVARKIDKDFLVSSVGVKWLFELDASGQPTLSPPAYVADRFDAQNDVIILNPKYEHDISMFMLQNEYFPRASMRIPPASDYTVGSFACFRTTADTQGLYNLRTLSYVINPQFNIRADYDADTDNYTLRMTFSAFIYVHAWAMENAPERRIYF